jgi:glycosyltransferase involved in cell wall biosynthesis
VSVAIVHDYLNQPGGAERVVLEMARKWPQAPVYTSLYREESTWPEFRALDVRTSLLDRVPVDQRFRALLPLYPAAFRSLGTLEQDLVVSSSSGWAHAVRTSPESLHVVYCYAPARWLYSDGYVSRRAARRALAPVSSVLRRWDRRAAARADGYITIAENVRERVRAAYGIDSEVVYPPVSLERFTPRPRGERLLVVSRLLPYKRVDLVVEAATRAKLPLDVVGVGPALGPLREMAGPTVTFHGKLPDRDVTELIEGCRAVCFPGREDFGIVPVEANAAGKPVIAYAAGGALETLREGYSGVFFQRQDADAVLDAIRRAERLDTPPERLAESASRFSPGAFRENLGRAIERIAERRAAGPARH